MLATDIYTFNVDRWRRFTQTSKSSVNNANGLYLKHCNENHYEVVKCVKILGESSNCTHSNCDTENVGIETDENVPVVRKSNKARNRKSLSRRQKLKVRRDRYHERKNLNVSQSVSPKSNDKKPSYVSQQELYLVDSEFRERKKRQSYDKYHENAKFREKRKHVVLRSLLKSISKMLNSEKQRNQSLQKSISKMLNSEKQRNQSLQKSISIMLNSEKQRNQSLQKSISKMLNLEKQRNQSLQTSISKMLNSEKKRKHVVQLSLLKSISKMLNSEKQKNQSLQTSINKMLNSEKQRNQSSQKGISKMLNSGKQRNQSLQKSISKMLNSERLKRG
uniref:Uncharacterized protein DDB_G0290301-like n=1 Tax=Saccoglossus kowalevskii TaxID=10224 RepID=A0ABM0M0Q1_SACKO|nr:PREDICTED: uncharacterized protein DDB_G0290301-like [Saccoglossus kowalevskii]